MTRRPTAAAWLCLALLLAGATMGLHAAREKSLTYDEQFYMGNADKIVRGESLCDYEYHPPLSMMLGALGMRVAGTRAEPWPRVPMLVVFVATGALAAWWSAQLFGPAAAIAASALYGFSPTMLAHASLLATDFPVAAAMFVNLYALRAFLAAPSAGRALVWSVTLAIALLTKLTALLLLPATAVVVAIMLVMRAIRPRLAHLWPLLLAPIVIVVGTWAAYGFDTCGFALFQRQLAIRTFQNQSGAGCSTYILGRVYERGVWWFYLASTALKEPLAYLVLVVLACVRPVRPRGGWAELAVLLAPAAVVFVVASASIHQLGQRYILAALLPLYPWVAGLATTPSPRVRAAVWAAVLLCVVDAVHISPHFLAYTNQLVPSMRAYDYVADSNLDWKQDSYTPENAAARAKWDLIDPDRPIGALDPAKPPALLIGGTALSGMWVRDGFWGSPFTRHVRERGYRAVDHVGYSLFVFPLDTAGLSAELYDWLLARSWAEAFNLSLRLSTSFGLVPIPVARPGPDQRLAQATCNHAVRRTAGGRVDVLESFAGPALAVAPPEIEWSGALQIGARATYYFRFGSPARSLVVSGRPIRLDQSRTVPNAPRFAVMRLAPGVYPFAVTQEGRLDGALDVTFGRVEFDPNGYAALVPLALGERLCLVDEPPAAATP